MQRTDTAEALDVIVVGAGQAGLAAAYHLASSAADGSSSLDAALRDRPRLALPMGLAAALHPGWSTDALPGMAFPAAAGTYPTKDEAADYLVE